MPVLKIKCVKVATYGKKNVIFVDVLCLDFKLFFSKWSIHIFFFLSCPSTYFEEWILKKEIISQGQFY